MIKFKDFIAESKSVFATVSAGYEDTLDFLDANGGYEALDQWAMDKFKIKSTYDSNLGKSTFEIPQDKLSEFEKAINTFGKLVIKNGNIEFKSIKTKKDFDALEDNGKLAFMYNWLTGNTDIQPSNIKDLVVKVTTKKAEFKSKSTFIDVGDNAISGMEELPFKLKMAELKKILKASDLK